MYIRKTTKHYKGRNYYNYLLVESVATPKGPRQRIICSLGSLSPGPRQKWRELAKKGESPEVGLIVKKVEQEQPKRSKRPQTRGEILPVLTEEVTLEEAREAGPAHVGHQMWLRLGVEQILQRAGLPPRARLLTEAMTTARLISPSSERAMVGWMKRCALSDILGDDLKGSEDTLYRHLDRLHSLRGKIESALAQKEKTLFSLDDHIYLYDLTSTYFEGSCTKNPQAQRGYSRDGRPDAKQVVVGLVLDAEGFR